MISRTFSREQIRLFHVFQYSRETFTSNGGGSVERTNGRQWLTGKCVCYACVRTQWRFMCISSLRIYRVSATVSWAHSGLWYQTPSSRKSFLQSLWSARTHVYTFLGGGSSSRETIITCHCCREYWYNCNAIRKNYWSNVIRVACSSAKGGSIQSTLQTPLAATLFNRLYDMIPTQYTVHVSCKWSLIKEFKVKV